MRAKRTHKLRGMGHAAKVIATAPSLSAAAKKLGVDRSTIHRWIESGKVARPGAKAKKADAAPAPAVPEKEPATWAAWVRESYELDETALMLVNLAEASLLMVGDPKAGRKDRLSAMGRFQQLVKQLNLDGQAMAGALKPATPAPRASRPRPAGGADPRGILMAVPK